MPAFFPPGVSISPRRSRWREFIEARDAVLGILSLPLRPSELLSRGPALAAELHEPPRRRAAQCSALFGS